MKQASAEYKKALNNSFRQKGYGVFSIGIITNEAQNSAVISNTSYFSDNTNPLSIRDSSGYYATFEDNQTKLDGTPYFPPEEDGQILSIMGAVSSDVLGSINIEFDDVYDLKGLTINFSEWYPTKFTVTINNTKEYTYTFNRTETAPNFTCMDNFDAVRNITITPLSFVDDNKQRLRIDMILMGIGIVFDNSTITKISFDDEISFVSDELPSLNLSATVLDTDKLFTVDDSNSFINYLETGQELSFTYGQTLENGDIEYIQLPTTYLSDWSSNGNEITFEGTDRIALFNSKYTAGNYIHSRTLYQDAIDVLTDLGLAADDYYVDDVLKNTTIINPLPSVSHAECLQLIANAGRCILTQGNDGMIKISANFENIVAPTNLDIETTSQTPWSKPSNIRMGTDYVYADFTENFSSLDGSMYFLPESDATYLETGFVSNAIGDSTGAFETAPTLTMKLPATYTYYGITILFDGNYPQEFTLQTLEDGKLKKTLVVHPTENECFVYEEFLRFDEMQFTFNKAHSNDRVVVNKISLGDITDYRIEKSQMTEMPVGTVEKKVKNVMVKMFTFEEPTSDDENPQEVDDDVYSSYQINTTGSTVTFENQLIHTQSHAELIAQWLGNYYANNVTYQVKYRGDPRIDGADILFLESDVLNNLQVEVEKHSLKYDGALSGTLDLRRATNMIEEA